MLLDLLTIGSSFQMVSRQQCYFERPNESPTLGSGSTLPSAEPVSGELVSLAFAGVLRPGRFLEFAYAAPERTPAFGETLRAEDEQQDDQQDREMGGREELGDHRYVPGSRTPA